ncbi:MAG: radical SAM protein [Nitrospirota bacterium]
MLEVLTKPISEPFGITDECRRYSAEEAATLLTLDPSLSVGQFQSIVGKAKLLKASLFSNAIFAVVPLYVTSICTEQCLYCNYRLGNHIQVDRHRLSDEELLKETLFLMEEKGFRTIELVYSADHSFGIDTICRHIELVRKTLETSGGGLIGLNAEPFTVDEYRLLKSAGIDFIVLWQETYDVDTYRQMHPGTSKKSNFEFRIDAYERMLTAGVEHIGLGVLSGLADWRKDWAMLLFHQEYLRNHYDMKSPIIGIPRLKASEGAVIRETCHIPTDDEFLFCTAIQCLFDPLSLPFVNTRESWDLCVRLSAGGGALFTFNCSTIPGGYSLGRKGYQFPTFDFDIGLHRERAEKTGLHTRMKWAFGDIDAKKADALRLCRDNHLAIGKR